LFVSVLYHNLRCLSIVSWKKVRSFLGFAPYQLTSLAGAPSVDTLLIHNLTDFQGVLLGGNALADIHIVNAIGEPDTHIAFAAHALVENFANFFWGSALSASNANLPTSLVFYDFTIAKGQALIVSQIADSADIDSTIGDVLHNFNSFLLEISSPFVTLVYHSRPDLSSVS
jgi:hypothetical protein